MREDPNPQGEDAKRIYQGETFERGTGEVKGFGALNLFAVTAFEKGQDVHMQVRGGRLVPLRQYAWLGQETRLSLREWSWRASRRDFDDGVPAVARCRRSFKGQHSTRNSAGRTRACA